MRLIKQMYECPGCGVRTRAWGAKPDAQPIVCAKCDQDLSPVAEWRVWSSRASRLLFWLRSVYLNAVTFGAWSQLGNFTMDLAESHREDVNRNDRTEHRLDGLMRFMEVDLQVTIPSTIEPPRLTTFGEGLSIEELHSAVRKSIEELGKPQTCHVCDGTGVVSIQGPPVLGKEGLERPLIPQACRRCTGSGVIGAADSEAGEVQVPEQRGGGEPPGGPQGG